MVPADVFVRLFGSFYWCGSATFSDFRGWLSSLPQAEKCVDYFKNTAVGVEKVSFSNVL